MREGVGGGNGMIRSKCTEGMMERNFGEKKVEEEKWIYGVFREFYE